MIALRTQHLQFVMNIKKDNRIKLFRNKENIGLTKSLNFLINQSKYGLLARQDSDDKSINID